MRIGIGNHHPRVYVEPRTDGDPGATLTLEALSCETFDDRDIVRNLSRYDASTLARALTTVIVGGDWVFAPANTDTADGKFADLAAAAEVLQLLRDHVMDYGGQCDRPSTCPCSDARARRLVGLIEHPSDQLAPTTCTVDNEVARWREHSVMLNSVAWRLSELLGEVPAGATEIAGPIDVLAQLNKLAELTGADVFLDDTPPPDPGLPEKYARRRFGFGRVLEVCTPPPPPRTIEPLRNLTRPSWWQPRRRRLYDECARNYFDAARGTYAAAAHNAPTRLD